jgi:hypothetical protein
MSDEESTAQAKPNGPRYRVDHAFSYKGTWISRHNQDQLSKGLLPDDVLSEHMEKGNIVRLG